ncbi:unnamed protein product [Symbiodinium pilosum]|uniref:Uncharacterized protein n=1 Tax=Symbiodinium pilosum TaxID=2952 RepID=A0A812T6N4_SYMPI|nr:unnamed protein product [Symbiodinium pilosum]
MAVTSWAPYAVHFREAGARLEFSLLRGRGPARGWVSLRVKGRSLLEAVTIPEEPETQVPQVALEDPDLGVANGWANWHGFRRALDIHATTCVANFRDVADSSQPILCRNGRTLRRGRLFRSGHMAAATAEDLVVLRELQLRTYVDLREGMDFEGADAPVYVELFPPSPKQTRNMPQGSQGESKLESARLTGSKDSEERSTRRVSCPLTKDLRLRPWTAAEKEGLEVRILAKDTMRCMRSGLEFMVVPAADSILGLFSCRMLAKGGLNVASHLAAVNRAVLFVNAEELRKALLVLTEDSHGRQ